MLPILHRARESARRTSCGNNLKQLGHVFQMFADDNSQGNFPKLDAKPGRFMFTADEVHEKYMPDTKIMICPSDSDRRTQWGHPADGIDDHSYIYLGYVITNMEEARAFADAYMKQLQTGEPFTANLTVPRGQGNGGGDTIYRLRKDIPYPTWAIPVLLERIDHHDPPGGMVLFMDGHVQYAALMHEAGWFISQEFMDLIEELESECAEMVR